VSRGPAAVLSRNLADSALKVVVNNKAIGGGSAKVLQRLAHGLAGVVHGALGAQISYLQRVVNMPRCYKKIKHRKEGGVGGGEQRRSTRCCACWSIANSPPELCGLVRQPQRYAVCLLHGSNNCAGNDADRIDYRRALSDRFRDQLRSAFEKGNDLTGGEIFGHHAAAKRGKKRCISRSRMKQQQQQQHQAASAASRSGSSGGSSSGSGIKQRQQQRQQQRRRLSHCCRSQRGVGGVWFR
jgi:hypothetical protein